MICKTRTLLLLSLVGIGLEACQTSCADSTDPILWADGIIATSGGKRTYQTTLVDASWLHFPSHRSFRLRHGLGTKDVSIEARIAFDPHPVTKGTKDVPKDFALASGNEFLVTEVTKDEVVVENDTCENSFYLWVRITEQDQ